MAGLQVLHVDDEPDMRLLVKLSLDLDDGISTRSASTGEEALAVTSQWRPDVILLDAAMPGMDGLATLRALQSDPKTAGIPVVFLTARCDAADLDSFTANGSAGVIPKPFDVRGLASAIRAHARHDDPHSTDAPATPDFVGRGPTTIDATAPAGTTGAARALLLDGNGGAFALTAVETGPVASWDAFGDLPHHGGPPAFWLDVTPLDAPTLGHLLGTETATLVRGHAIDQPDIANDAAAWDISRAAGCAPVSCPPVTAPVAGREAFTFGSASPGATPDWLVGLMPRGLLH